MARTTQKLGRPTRSRAALLQDLRAWFRQKGTVAVVGFGFTAILIVAVILSAIRPRGSRGTAELGRWRPFLSTDDANYAIAIEYDVTTGILSLGAKPGELATVIPDPREREYVHTHIRRFNRAVRGRRYFPAMVPRDCVLRVEFEKKGEGGEVPVLRVRDLSPYDAFPARARQVEPLGPIYMRPSPTPVPFFSDGYIGLFLNPAARPTAQTVDMSHAGLYSGDRITLIDEEGVAKATVWPGEDGASVMVRGEGGRRIFIDNNAPELGEQRPVEQGQLVEIAGRFFETRVESSGILALSSQRGEREKRLYPLGPHLHIVGPVSLSGTHQPLGIEYMFREYLEGVAEEGVPPGAIWLTIDPGLQSMFGESVQTLVRESESGVASGLIMNAKTGAILAMAAAPGAYDPGNLDQVFKMLDSGADRYANHGCFKRHVIGSVTKPFFAFLAMQLHPDVTQLRFQAGGNRTDKLFGHDLYGSKNRYFKIKYPRMDFREYLVQSANTFQHGLGMLLLAGIQSIDDVPPPWGKRDGSGAVILSPTRDAGFLKIGGLGAVGRNSLVIRSDNRVAAALREIFHIQTTTGKDILDDRDISIYGDLLETAAELLRRGHPGVREVESILKRRSVVCAPESPRMELEDVRNTKDASNLLYGGNRNHWTDVKLCESFSRMITGRKVRARLVHQFLDTLNPDEKTGSPALVVLEKEAPPFRVPEEIRAAFVFDELRAQLEQVPRRGTAKLLAPALAAIRNKPGMARFKLFGKTGTIDDGKPDSKLFVGCFGLWDEARRDFEGNAYSFVFYLKNARDPDAILQEIMHSLAGWWEQAPKPVNEPI